MPDTVIRVENLSKKYRLGENQQGGYKTLREKLNEGAKALSRRVLLQPSKPGIINSESQDFWALQNVSFEIQQGERVGFVGRNGAGKSTLLKVLSRITEPTKGRISVRGRVASLLEVGTGFHPELTGKENVYLNGAILGMGRVEIKRKFDEIVAFAEVEKFLDTPVKRYSSGMYVRLAFAVAAHLEPEILIIDEVLAVGDAQFQKKCLDKMGEVAREGRTVLFVSHNMGAISTLCDKAIHLTKGKVTAVGSAADIVSEYLTKMFENKAENLDQMRLPGFGKDVRFEDIQISSEDGTNLLFNEPIKFIFKINSDIDVADELTVGTSIYESSGNCVGTYLAEKTFSSKAGQRFLISITIHNLKLAPGSYYATSGISWGEKDSQLHQLDIVQGWPSFQILPVSYESKQAVNWHPNWGRLVIQDADLTIEEG